MSVYTQADVIREKAELATCEHYCEEYDYTPMDWPCGFVTGTCLHCEAPIERDVMYFHIDTEFVGPWRLSP